MGLSPEGILWYGITIPEECELPDNYDDLETWLNDNLKSTDCSVDIVISGTWECVIRGIGTRIVVHTWGGGPVDPSWIPENSDAVLAPLIEKLYTMIDEDCVSMNSAREDLKPSWRLAGGYF